MRKLWLILLLFVVAACASETPTATPDISSLNGTHWELVEMNGQPLLEGSHITLEIGNGLRKGNAGCNWYDEKPVTPPPFRTDPQVLYTLTVQLCPSAALMEQEDRYVKFLFSTKLAQAVQEGQTLTLFNADGKAVLVFEQSD